PSWASTTATAPPSPPAGSSAPWNGPAAVTAHEPALLTNTCRSPGTPVRRTPRGQHQPALLTNTCRSPGTPVRRTPAGQHQPALLTNTCRSPGTPVAP